MCIRDSSFTEQKLCKGDVKNKGKLATLFTSLMLFFILTGILIGHITWQKFVFSKLTLHIFFTSPTFTSNLFEIYFFLNYDTIMFTLDTQKYVSLNGQLILMKSRLNTSSIAHITHAPVPVSGKGVDVYKRQVVQSVLRLRMIGVCFIPLGNRT